MDRNLILKHFGFVRNSLVMASLGEYSEYEHLALIVKDAIKNEQESVEKNNTKIDKIKEKNEEER